MNLHNTFKSLCKEYSNNILLIDSLWREIEQAYTYKKRYYHNLTHLQNMIEELAYFKENALKWDILLFSIFYHDIVYNTLQQDNEYKSAVLASERMKELCMPSEVIEQCSSQIIASKTHQKSKDKDTNLFLDADLAILGQNWEVYKIYTEQIRKEYSFYPSLLYKSGRKKVLKHFLEMDSIYKTSQFVEKYEQQAKENLARELELY